MAATKRAIIVITAADQASMNTWFKANVDAVGGENTFTVGLSNSGAKPFSHYVCNIATDESSYNRLVTQFDGVDGGNGARKLDSSQLMRKTAKGVNDKTLAEVLSDTKLKREIIPD